VQLSPDSADIDAAIEELKRKYPLVYLPNLVHGRRIRHKASSALQRQYEILVAAELAD
jgi:hypothetical protein